MILDLTITGIATKYELDCGTQNLTPSSKIFILSINDTIYNLLATVLEKKEKSAYPYLAFCIRRAWQKWKKNFGNLACLHSKMNCPICDSAHVLVINRIKKVTWKALHIFSPNIAIHVYFKRIAKKQEVFRCVNVSNSMSRRLTKLTVYKSSVIQKNLVNWVTWVNPR